MRLKHLHYYTSTACQFLPSSRCVFGSSCLLRLWLLSTPAVSASPANPLPVPWAVASVQSRGRQRPEGSAESLDQRRIRQVEVNHRWSRLLVSVYYSISYCSPKLIIITSWRIINLIATVYHYAGYYQVAPHPRKTDSEGTPDQHRDDQVTTNPMASNY